MKKFELKINDVSNLANLTNQIAGTLANWKTAQKIEQKVLLNQEELEVMSTGKNEKGEETYDMVKIAKTVELSDDEFKLLKETLDKLIADEEVKKSSYVVTKALINLDELLNEKAITEESAA